MKKEDCIFCKLANGIIPTNSIYEDEDFKVILDADPATKGHALILPKEHFANIYEVDDAVAAKILPLAKRLATHMTEKLGCDGFNILQNNGEAAGQTVFHLHVHLVPRYDDGRNILTWSHVKFTEEETKEICESLQMK
ncbi:MAG: HIT family protein [Lachnospiraceae bacterium]|nr:HIT family protein [Lachnospiraceae bacterium]